MNEFESLLEELDDLIEDAWRLPLSNGKIVIEREELARIVGGLHTHYPTEIARAKICSTSGRRSCSRREPIRSA